MRKSVFVIILIMCCFYAISAQQPESIKSTTTGSVIEGVWEKIYDPIDLRYIADQYYFTSLADINQSIYKDYYGSYYTYSKKSFMNEFPFGMNFKNKYLEGMSHSFLIRYREAISNFGGDGTERENITTNYYGSSSENPYYYQFKEITKEKYSTKDEQDDNIYWLFNSVYPLNDRAIGLKLSYNKGIQSWNQSSYNYYNPFDTYPYPDYYTVFHIGDNSMSNVQEYYYVYNDTDSLAEKSSRIGDFDRTISSSRFSSMLSYSMPIMLNKLEREMRFDLIYSRNNSNKLKIKEFFSIETVNYDNNIESNFEKYSSSRDSLNEYTQNELFVKTTLKSIIQKSADRLEDSFWSLGAGMGYYGGDINNKGNFSSTTDYTIANDYRNTTTRNSKTNASGDYSGFHGLLDYNYNIKLSATVFFALGAKYEIYAKHEKTDNIESNSAVWTNVDSLFDDHNDWKRTTTSLYQYKQEVTSSYSITQIPVGLEFALPKEHLTSNDGFSLRNFKFRVGTIFIHHSNEIDSKEKFSTYQPNTLLTEFGDGAVTESQNDAQYTVSKITGKTSSSYKRFTGGIGYEHSKNLTLDLGGYLDDYNNDYYIGLMFTVKK